MGLAYLPTKLGSFGGVNIGKYTSPIEHLGYTLPESTNMTMAAKSTMNESM